MDSGSILESSAASCLPGADLLLAHLPLHPQQPHRHRGKALVGRRLVDRRRGDRPARRGRLPGRHPPRRHALRPLALAIRRPQVPADHDQAGQDRLHLLPRRRTIAALADAWRRSSSATTSRTPASFSPHGGQKGRQRGILREGVYAINIALFNVITEDRVFTLEYAKSLEEWQQQLQQVNGFSPV